MKRYKYITLFSSKRDKLNTYIYCIINSDGSIKNRCVIKQKPSISRKELKEQKRLKGKVEIDEYRRQCKEEMDKYIKEYKNSKGKRNRAYIIRKKWGKPKPINEYFKNSNLHHLHINNKTDCVYIPAELHTTIRHRHTDPESMNKINEAALEWLRNQ